MPKKELRFSFGENWYNYVAVSFNEHEVTLAANSLKELLQIQDLKGKSFLDIGCGSGLYSLAACELGAEHVVSFDFDEQAVKAAEALRNKKPQYTEKWSVLQGSVLDEEFLYNLQAADVVYSWGVLHHTGAMWKAIDNAISRVKPEGQLVIAIYNKLDRAFWGSSTWWQIKRIYNSSSPFVKRLMEYAYAINFVSRHLLTLRNPFKTIRNWGQSDKDKLRGMDFWYDVRDWLGGFPYEYATAGEIFNYIYRKHGLRLEYLTTTYSFGNNQFVFRRAPASDKECAKR